MKVTILNGNPSEGNTAFDGYLKELTEVLQSSNHTVVLLKLRDMDIRYCIGCYGCFVKTPGECTVKDDSRDVRREYINSDLVLFASPVIMGFTSALLKKVQDRLLPLIHPYFELYQNQMHHIPRYDKYPLIALLLEKGRDTDEMDVKIVSDIYRREAVNLNTSLCFARLTTDSPEDVANEINRV